ncbi:MAG: hypothetical protein HY554_15790 [Elusimicrobia bacterium]|nr:hypothetical protein [Elusimicrobiota bacterium]
MNRFRSLAALLCAAILISAGSAGPAFSLQAATRAAGASTGGGAAPAGAAAAAPQALTAPLGAALPGLAAGPFLKELALTPSITPFSGRLPGLPAALAPAEGLAPARASFGGHAAALAPAAGMPSTADGSLLRRAAADVAGWDTPSAALSGADRLFDLNRARGRADPAASVAAAAGASAVALDPNAPAAAGEPAAPAAADAPMPAAVPVLGGTILMHGFFPLVFSIAGDLPHAQTLMTVGGALVASGGVLALRPGILR